MKEDGLCVDFEGYENLDERVVADWRLLQDARNKLAERTSRQQTMRQRR